MQNYWKNMRENHKYFEMTLEMPFEFFFFIYFKYFDIIIILLLNILGWTWPNHPSWAGTGLTRLSQVGLLAAQYILPFFLG
jgi:hypothetical protein